MSAIRQVTTYFAFFLLFILSVYAESPEDVRLEKTSYRKVTISWLPPEETTGISHYVIFRDGEELGETTDLYYTDETVLPGTRYAYKIFGVMKNGQTTDFSNELSVQTMTSSAIENSQLIEDIVDAFHDEQPANLNAVSLLSAVKAGFEAMFGSNLFFSVVDENLVVSAIVEELDLINSVTPELTETERVAIQEEIDDIMESSFAGNSFDHTYINQLLTALGDKHWEAGNQLAAKLFYEMSLNYLSNHELTVCHSLSRLAYFAKSHLSQESSREDISENLAVAKSYLDSYFDYFPEADATSAFAKMALSLPIGWYFMYFPKMLEYSDYDAQFFSIAQDAAERLVAFAPEDISAERLLEKVAAWELVPLQLRFVDEKGKPRSGTVKICNVSAENGMSYLFPGEASSDERDFQLFSGSATIPVYAGHDYSISMTVEVPGGNALHLDFPILKFEKNRQIAFDCLTNKFKDEFSLQSGVDFVISSEPYPYNLRADLGIDTFDLSWDWATNGNFEVAGFKIYRGEVEVASVTEQTVRLSIGAPEEENSYRVVAFDANGNLSAASPILFVYPENPELYSDFFEWMEGYFSGNLFCASDDPDGDGVDNYHEFLNGTDPSKIPGPMPFAGPIGFNELILEWDAISDDPDAIYQISRNDTIVGISTSNKFTDTNLVPGVTYSYRVRLIAPSASETDWGLPNTFSTQKAHGYEYADKVQRVVDRFLKFDIPEYSGPALFSAVRSAMEALTGSTIAFSVIRTDLVEEMAEQELSLLRTACPAMTTAERIATKEELNKIMEEYWEGNSFEEMYINNKLTELAEEHWQEYMDDRANEECKNAAIELLETSLFFLNNHEPTVRNTLVQMARYELMALDATSTESQIKDALNSSRDTLLRIYDYIPNPAEEISNPYKLIIGNYKKYFPRLLTYDNYDQMLFDNVLQMAAVYRDQNIADARRHTLYDEVASWQLSNLTVACGVVNGTITFENVTPQYSSMPWGNDGVPVDSRTFQLNGTPLVVPVYSGHIYDVTIRITVTSGEDWIHTVSGLKFSSGTMTTADPFTGITIESIPADKDNTVFAFPVSAVTFPYNLVYEKFPDTVTLSWQYVSANGSCVDHYNIYRGNTLVATSSENTCSGIPRTVCADGVYTYSVSAVDVAGIESDRSPIIEILPDFSEDEQRYFEWKQRYFGNASVLATDDGDGDGMTNYQEYLLGSNPVIAPIDNPMDSVTNILSGGTIRYYSGPFSSYPDFDSLSPYKIETVNTISQNTDDEFFNSGVTNSIAAFINGYFDITVAGTYRFYLQANGGAELSLDKVPLISCRNDGNNDVSADIYLETGTHLLELGFLRNGIQPTLQLSWAGPNFGKSVFGNILWHTDEDESFLTEAMNWQKDSDFDGIPDRIERSRGLDPLNPDTDGDGLTDYQELYVFFTNPVEVDTDGDGIDDYEEVTFALSNPLVADFSGTPQILQSLDGIDFSSASAGWYSHGKSIDCENTKGYISYPIILPSKGVYVLEISGEEALNPSSYGEFSIDLEIAGTVCKSKKLVSSDDGTSAIRFYLPLLSAGTYNAKLIWNNIDQNKTLRINKIRLLSIDAPDNDENSVPDWIDHRLVMLQKNNIPNLSFTSPLCVEGGKGAPLDDIQVSSIADNKRPYLNADNNVIWTDSSDERIVNGELTLAVPEVSDSINDQFYANVELSPEAISEISIDRNGYKTVQNVEWKDTNVLYTPTITIRSGDALLLSVRPVDNISGSAIVTIDGERLEFASESAKIPYRFDSAGTFTVFAEFTSSTGTLISGEMIVKVIEASFEGMPYSLARIERNWSNERIPAEADIECDDGIIIFRSDSESGANISFCGNTPGRFNIVARLGNQGPIMATSQLCILDSMTHKADGYYKVIDSFNDGTKLIEGKILLSEVPEDLSIRLTIYTTGTTFLDGTLVKILTAEDFDENGLCRYQMLKAEGSPTSTCHGISFYQGGLFLFSYQN